MNTPVTCRRRPTRPRPRCASSARRNFRARRRRRTIRARGAPYCGWPNVFKRRTAASNDAAQQTQRAQRHPRALLVLTLLVIISALGAVYAKHQTRKLFVELQGLHKARDDMDIDWGQLQLEQSTWATHGRIEDVANAKLGMVFFVLCVFVVLLLCVFFFCCCLFVAGVL